MENTQPGRALKTTFLAAAVAASLLIPQKSQAWGYLGHQLVAETAATLSKTFWKANLESLGKLANVPDTVWKGIPEKEIEKPTHYFEPDGFYASPADFLKFPRLFEAAEKEYGVDKLVNHGTGTWRVEQFFNLAVAAAQKNDLMLAVQMAGAMSHYAGDLAQPLHVTTNYDGQATQNRGIHKFFETDNLEKAQLDFLKSAVLAKTQALLSDSNFMDQFKTGSVLDWSFVTVNIAYDQLDEVIQVDKELGRQGKGAEQQLNMAVARIAEGAAALSLIYTRIWKEAGSFPGEETLKIKVPTWVKPIYMTKTPEQDTAPEDQKPVETKNVEDLPTYEDLKKLTRRDIQSRYWGSAGQTHDHTASHADLGHDCYE